MEREIHETFLPMSGKLLREGSLKVLLKVFISQLLNSFFSLSRNAHLNKSIKDIKNIIYNYTRRNNYVSRPLELFNIDRIIN